jgi:hypothetical protein
MKEVTLLRLYLLRAMYVFVATGIGLNFWPRILEHSNEYATRHGTEICLLGGIGALAALGVRYPLQLLPILLFEFFWKSTWVLSMGIPLWLAGKVDAGVQEDFFAVGLGVVLCPLVIPWGYVLTNYIQKPGDRWK